MVVKAPRMSQDKAGESSSRRKTMTTTDVLQPSDQTPVETSEKKRRFTFPTAYTILALLIIVVAALTFVIPAGRYDTDADGAPIPGTYHTVEPNPQRLVDAVLAPINGMYGIKDAEGNVNV